jgi:DNA polymerase-3 subunit epsilon
VPALSKLDVLVVDCQATAAAPKGHLLELGWARVDEAQLRPQARLIRLPEGERIRPAVTRVTGISNRMAEGGVEAQAAWCELLREASSLPQQPAPTAIHFARFERPFLEAVTGGALPLDIVCTHEIALRLLPGLPRRSLRALAGYFGRAVGLLRRCADHVEATAFVWRELAGLLEAEGVSTWGDVRDWLATSSRTGANGKRSRVWPMPRELRLSLPDAPGVYRMLRTSGDVLYVGKASSLHHRVNSYFRKQHGVHERTLEMLSQARALSFEVTPTALEAALLEPDEIKRHRPPYNVALVLDDREVWFASTNLAQREPHPSARCPVGPFPSADLLDRFAALGRADVAALGSGRSAPPVTVFDEGYARFRAADAELVGNQRAGCSRLLSVGARLWREGRRDAEIERAGTDATDRPDRWTPETVQASLEWLALRAALALRRARWLTRMTDATVVFTGPSAGLSRLVVVENGDVVLRSSVDPGAEPPVPPGHLRPVAARHAAFTLARLDRLTVLTTELKRLVSEGVPVALRFGAASPLEGERLSRALSWV